MGAKVKYTASVDRNDITITRWVYAGITGPAGTYPLPSADGNTSFTMAELNETLRGHEWEVTSQWRAVVCYDGIRLEADIVPIDRPVILPDVVEWTAPGR